MFFSNFKVKKDDNSYCFHYDTLNVLAFNTLRTGDADLRF